MFPGEDTSFSVDVGSRTGSFPNTGVCAEFCGLDHHKMRFSVRIVTPDEFAQWLRGGRPMTAIERDLPAGPLSVDDFLARAAVGHRRAGLPRTLSAG